MADYHQRDRSRSPGSRRRSRSPNSRHQRNRSYSPRSRSRSRDGYRRSDRRSRSPIGAGGGASSAARPSRGSSNYESKDQAMASLRENSQQDRRVYVGNLSYDVKWHHLKDFMRQGTSNL
jgi:hypothetical protein